MEVGNKSVTKWLFMALWWAFSVSKGSDIFSDYGII
jgi:hypothetical protein